MVDLQAAAISYITCWRNQLLRKRFISAREAFCGHMDNTASGPSTVLMLLAGSHFRPSPISLLLL